jgi:ribosomal-protein-alanine N-acetyltransferase
LSCLELPGLRIRAVQKKDMSAIYNIEDLTFREPYSRSLLDLLAEKYAETFLVAEVGGTIVGYVVASFERGGSGHIISIAVAENHKRRGVGSALASAIIEIMKNFEVQEIRLEVRRSNLAAQNFYNRLGFEFRSVSKGYYGREDGYVFTRVIE